MPSSSSSLLESNIKEQKEEYLRAHQSKMPGVGWTGQFSLTFFFFSPPFSYLVTISRNWIHDESLVFFWITPKVNCLTKKFFWSNPACDLKYVGYILDVTGGKNKINPAGFESCSLRMDGQSFDFFFFFFPPIYSISCYFILIFFLWFK